MKKKVSRKEETEAPDVPIYKDHQMRAWEVVRIPMQSIRCSEIKCISLASYHVRRRIGNLGRQEYKCGRHWVEFSAAVGLKLVEPSDKD
jgi:hypothetical protein